MSLISNRLASAALATLVIVLLAYLFSLSPGDVQAQSSVADEAVPQQLRSVFSDDGTKLASTDDNGRIVVLDLESGQELAAFEEALGAVTALAFSPDGQVLASAGGDAITLRSLADSAELTILPVDPERTITRLAFSPRGDALAVVDNVEISVWNLGGEAVRSGLSSDKGAVTEIAFSPDGESLASYGSDSPIALWNLAAGQVALELASPTGAQITGMAFGPVGMILAGADEDANILLWDAQSGDQRVLSNHEDLIKRLRFSPDGATLASEGMDAQLMLWDVASGQNSAALPAQFDTLVTGLAFSPDGATLASVGENDEILLWEVSSGSLVQVLSGHLGLVEEIVFSASGQTLASVDTKGQVIVWDLDTGTERFALQPFDSAVAPEDASSTTDPSAAQSADSQAPTTTTSSTPAETANAIPLDGQASTTTAAQTVSTAITSLAVSTDGSLIASASKDGSIHVFNSTGTELKVFRGGEAEVSGAAAAVSSVVFSPDGSALFSGGRDSVLRRFTREDGRIRQRFRVLEHPIRAVALSYDGRYLAASGDETRVGVWNANTGKVLRILPRHKDDKGNTDFGNALAFKPNEIELACGGKDGVTRRWGSNGRLIDALLGHAGAVNTLAYSNDGAVLASGSSDGTVKLWDTKKGPLKVRAQSQTLDPAVALSRGENSAPVKAIAFSPDGQQLASAGEDGVVYIWNFAVGGRLIKTLGADGSSYVTALAYLPNGLLLVGRESGTIEAWDVENNQIRRTITPTPLAKVDGVFEMPNLLSQDRAELASSSIERSAEPGTDGSSDTLLVELVGRFLDWLVPAAYAQADPNQGPGGPILVIDSASSLFGKYYAEILRTEGFNAFLVADIDSVDQAMLDAHDVVILAETSLSGAQTTLLSDWVNAGGNLIAMRPDPQLASLLGLTDAGSTLEEGYLLVDTSASPGNGIEAQTMQFHGTADRYDLNGAIAVATLYSDATTATSYPAVTLRDVGTNGGQAAAFAYDLATSVVYTRQGNPAWANDERDGFAPQRSDDKYYGDKLVDPQPDWVDLNKVAIPQADEQQRLLANLILHMNLDKRPLPRFWYLPRGEKAVVIMTGDDHANNATAGRFEEFIAASPQGCVVEDWACVRGTSYIYPNPGLTDTQAAAYEAQGFEVGLHVNTNCADYTEAQLEAFYVDQINEFRTQWPSAPPPTTQRHHCIAWTDWVTGAKVQLEHGVRLDTSYYFWPPSWVDNVPGNFNGSAMPMRFADLDGTLIDVYQANSQMTDESGQTYPFTIDTLLDRALGNEGYYGAYTINAHTDVTPIPESDAVVASAQARDVPIITSRQMLEWLDGRNSSSFELIAWDGSVLSFTVTAGTGANGLQALVPMNFDAGVVNSVTRNGTSISYTSAARKGIDYASFSATDGDYVVTYGADTTAPTVTSVFPADGSTDVSQGTDVSVVFSEGMDAATINTSTFELLDGATPVSASVSYDAQKQTATLTPSSSLEANKTYTAIVSGGAGGVTDLSGNPLAGDVSWTFTTGETNCPCSIWTDSDTPAIESFDDLGPVEVGVKFRSDIDGFITGIRFYKGSANTGTHVGNLWAADDTPLASAIFTNETASGWQQVDFPEPVAITANTVYVASYHAPNGGYAVNIAGFAGTGVDNPPLHALADGDVESPGNGVFVYGQGDLFPNQTFNANNFWVDVVFNETAGGDTDPPTVTSRAPAPGATDVAVGTVVTATFSEAMDAATITTSTFELRDASNTLVPAAVTYDGATNTATLTPNSALDFVTLHTATVKGGTTGVKDLADNALNADVTWSFTTGGEQICPCTVWSESDVPTNPAEEDPNAVEIGVKFRSAVDGLLTGIRFYKGAGNTGTHVGNLWASDGILLASATFVNETATGWQQVDFDTPVAISANTVYVASYYAPNGNYASDEQYFADTGVDNGYLHLLQDGVNGGNGVYVYGSSSEFPSFTWQSSNYWVDVVFTTGTGGDTTPPTVTSTSPADGAVVGVETTVTATFNEAMDPATITASTFQLQDGGGAVTATVTYEVATRTATLTPDSALDPGTAYTATVTGGTGGVTDLAGNELETNKVWSFTTTIGGPAPELSFSTVGNSAVPGVASPYDDADLYTFDGTAYARIVDAVSDLSLPGNADIDGLAIVDTDTFYVSFNRNGGTNVPGLGVVQDEDVVLYDTGTWSLYFDGSDCGLDLGGSANIQNKKEIDALDVVNGVLYFSTLGGGSNGAVGGVAGPYDDADIYSWDGASCVRVFDASANGLPGNADIDGLTVKGGIYYMSFNRNGGVSVPAPVGTVQDEAVVAYDTAIPAWSLYFSGVGLDVANGQDVDALHVP